MCLCVVHIHASRHLCVGVFIHMEEKRRVSEKKSVTDPERGEWGLNRQADGQTEVEVHQSLTAEKDFQN